MWNVQVNARDYSNELGTELTRVADKCGPINYSVSPSWLSMDYGTRGNDEFRILAQPMDNSLAGDEIKG